MNDILKPFKDGAVCITLYADDTDIYCADADPSKACNEIEVGLLYIRNWCDRSKLTINVKKQQHMLLKPRTNSPDLDQHRHFGSHSPQMRRTEHHCSIMYRLSRMGKNLEKHRPNINLRSRNKLKFKY